MLAAALALALCCRVSADAFEPQGFIKVCNGQFADEDGRVWYFSGACHEQRLRHCIAGCSLGHRHDTSMKTCLQGGTATRIY